MRSQRQEVANILNSLKRHVAVLLVAGVDLKYNKCLSTFLEGHHGIWLVPESLEFECIPWNEPPELMSLDLMA